MTITIDLHFIIGFVIGTFIAIAIIKFILQPLITRIFK